jgi:hypothetical protein
MSQRVAPKIGQIKTRGSTLGGTPGSGIRRHRGTQFNQSVGVFSSRRTSLDNIDSSSMSEGLFLSSLLSECWGLLLLWKLSGINSHGMSAAEGTPVPRCVLVLRAVLLSYNLCSWVYLSYTWTTVGASYFAAFYVAVCLLIALPCQAMAWRLHDVFDHRMHLLLMLCVVKTHMARAWRYVNHLALLVMGVVAASTGYIAVVFVFYDAPAHGLDYGEGAVVQARNAAHWPTANASLVLWSFAMALNVLSWAPCGFSLVLSTLAIMAGHFSECEHLNGMLHTDYKSYISSGDALYDLHVVFLRVVTTSSAWSLVVLWALAGSSVVFFLMIISFLRDGMLWAVFPMLGIMLPALWVTGLAAGSISARFTRIYISVNARAPLLLNEIEADVVSNMEGVGQVERKKSEIAQKSDLEEGRGGAKSESGQCSDGNSFSPADMVTYKREHTKLLELCKHFEDIFGVRILGMKVTNSHILQILTFYSTGTTIILQNKLEGI